MTKIYPPKYLETGIVDGEPTFPQGYEIVEIEADDSSYYQDSYQNSTFIELHFKLDHYYDFKKYSRLEHHLYIKVGLGGSLSRKDNIVTLEEPTFTKYSETHYEYTLKFYNAWREKYRRRFVKDPQTGNTTFSLTGTELQHLECIIRSIVTDWNIDDVMMQVYLGQFTGTAYVSNASGSGTWNAVPFWTASTEIKTISYDGTTCADALEQLSEMYGHEYNYNFEYLSYFYIPGGVANRPWVDQSGRYGFRLYSDTAENNTALEYGQGKGLKKINVNGVQDIVDILFVNGSEKNIIISGANRYDSNRLHLPKKESGARAILLYNGTYFLPASGVYRENDNHVVPPGYVEYVASGSGASVMKYGVSNKFGREEVVRIDDVYPSRVGSVTNVSVDNDGIYSIFDSGCDIDYVVPDGIDGRMSIVFQDGALAGMEFQVQNGSSQENILTNIASSSGINVNIYNGTNTYTKTLCSFHLSDNADVLLNITPRFTFNNYRQFGNSYSFSVMLYLKKGNTTINSWNIGYRYLTMVTSEHGSWPKGAEDRGSDGNIYLTTSLTSGDYDIIIVFTFNTGVSVIDYYTGNFSAYIQGSVRANFNANFSIVPTQIGEETLPNATLHPAVGDHYIVFNVEMPQSYITAAEINLFKEAVKQLAEYQADGTTYSVEVDGKFMNNNTTINQGLSSGLCLKIQDNSFMTLARTFRIVNVKRPYNNENSPQIEISNVKRKKSRFDGFTHSIIELGAAVANSNELISLNSSQLKSTEQQLQNSINDVDFDVSTVEFYQDEINKKQADMEKRVSENESQIQELWKAIGK